MSVGKARYRLWTAAAESDRAQRRFERARGTAREGAARERLEKAREHAAMCEFALRLAEQPDLGRPAMRRR
jgi:hypothetical protein